MARDGAKKFGAKFAAGLHDGVAIAWQNMPHIKGGWADWHAFNDPKAAVDAFNVLVQGTGVDGAIQPAFFIVGDQVSSLPGWQEGAIASALNAISRMTRPDLEIRHLKSLPDTRLMVEGI
jgi:monoamine oxidase